MYVVNLLLSFFWSFRSSATLVRMCGFINRRFFIETYIHSLDIRNPRADVSETTARISRAASPCDNGTLASIHRRVESVT